nr:unnamed protein product [Callosobruchus analis]
MASITDLTFKQYNGAYAYGEHFVWTQNVNPYQVIVGIGSVLKFLTFHFNKGTTLNSYRSAISQIVYQTWDRIFGSGAFSKELLLKDHRKRNRKIFGIHKYFIGLGHRPRITTLTLIKILKRHQGFKNWCDWLLIASKKSHRKASTSTITRWIKGMLESSVLEMFIFKPQSTRMLPGRKSWG